MYYFVAAMVLFFAQILFGMISGMQYIMPDLFYNQLDFNTTRMVHINAMIVWLLFGFIGSVYWLVEDEAGTELVGAKLAMINFWVLTTPSRWSWSSTCLCRSAPGNLNRSGLSMRVASTSKHRAGLISASWFACWCSSITSAATFMKGRWSGISGVLVLDLVALAGIYVAGMYFTPNISVDQHWWWWVIHLWVEATWEVLVGCIMAWGLIKTLGASRKIVTTWLYIEVAMMFGSGILGLGHHYFWIGTPEYWLTIGGFFSALEPIPFVAMVVHAVYDSGRHGFKSSNHPALAWLIAHAFGNFFGAGVWGFMHTLPQINLYTHGTQWTSSHGHLAFFGAYATINIAMIYMALQRVRGNVWMSAGLADSGWKWKWSLGLLNGGMLGMTMALLIAGYDQSFIERALEGSTWSGYFLAQQSAWFVQGMHWRMVFGCMMSIGIVLLFWDMLTIGRTETRPVQVLSPVPG